MFDWSYEYQTRQAADEKIKPKGIPKLESSLRSFRFRAADQFNQLPQEVVASASVESFKRKVKPWIIENVKIKS